MEPACTHPVIDILPEQKKIEGLGGNMRLGGQDVDAIEQARRNWEELGQVAIKAEIYSIGFSNAVAAICSTHYQGGMQDYFGPPSEALLKKAQQAKASPPRKIGAPPSKM